MIQRANIRRSKQGGFTIIELTLAMAFVSALLLTIALTVIQIANTYNRGITVKEVNQSARDVADTLQRTISSSKVFEVTSTGSDTTDSIKVKDGTFVVGGRVCMGSYSLIWNSFEAITNKHKDLTYIMNTSTAKGDVVRFAKVPDPNKDYCKLTTGKPTYPNIRFADKGNTIELLKGGDHTISLLKFDITSSSGVYDEATGQRLYMASYTLAAGEIDTMDLTASPPACYPPGDTRSNFNYCNIQQFSLVLRAGNKVN